MTHTPARRTRTAGAAGLLTALAVGATTLAAVATGPAIAAPTPDCAAPFPVAELAKNDPVTGLTVTTGTEPQSFTGEVLGVLTDGIAPGLDMIMVKVDPSGLGIDTDEVRGIWQGMSGSPVYAADGRLIGAVAYGLAWAEQSWVAGVTPFEEMDDYLSSGAAGRQTVKLSGAHARTVARAAGVSDAQARKGFTQLPLPTVVTGVPARFLEVTKAEARQHPWLMRGAQAAGRATGEAAPTADSIVAGGNLAAALAYGDVTMAGVGTATSVCGDEVVGWGHPMNFLGETTMTLHPADALYVQGDIPAFKVANIGDPVGTVTGDRMTGLTGAFGALPEAADVTSTVTGERRTSTLSSHVPERIPDVLANSIYMATAANHARALDASAPGSETLHWTISGTDADGSEFSLDWTDRYVSTWALGEDVGFLLGNYAYQIGSWEGVEIDDIRAESTDITDSTAMMRIKQVEQRRNGSWDKISPRKILRVEAGSKLAIRATLQLSDGTSERVRFAFQVPKDTKRQFAELRITGGLSTWLNLGRSVSDAEEALANAFRSDQVRAFFGKPGANYRANGGQAKFIKEETSPVQDLPVRGRKSFTVRIR